MYKQIAAVALLTLPACAAIAGDSQVPIGEQTRLWMEMQKSPDFTDPTPPPQDGEVATRAYQRYLKSFEHEIPERMTQESVSGGD